MVGGENWLDTCMDGLSTAFLISLVSVYGGSLSMYSILYHCGHPVGVGTPCPAGLLRICGDPHPLHPSASLKHVKNVPLPACAMELITVSETSDARSQHG